MGNLAALTIALLSLGTPSGVDLDALLATADDLSAAYEKASKGKGTMGKEAFALRTKIVGLFRNLEQAGGKRAVRGVARFFSQRDMEVSVASSLSRFGRRDAMAALDKLLETMSDDGKTCRNRQILQACSAGKRPLSAATLKRLLREEQHSDGVKASLSYMVRRFSRRQARLALEALDGATLAPGIAAMDRPQLHSRFSSALATGLAQLDNIVAGKETEDTSEARTSAARSRKETLEYLLDVVDADERAVSARIVALRVLADRKYEPARAVIAQLAEREIRDPLFIVNIAQAAAAFQEKSVGPFVLKHLKAMARNRKTTAALETEIVPLLETLVPLQVRDAAALVRKLARSRHLHLRAAATAALPVLDAPDAIRGIRSALREKRWQLRRAAIEACRGMQTIEAVDLLVAHMTKEEGRLKYDVLLALQELSGANIPYIPADWRKWWKYARDTYQPPTNEKVQADSRTLVIQPSDKGRSYFGLEVISRRVCLVLDVSGSMSAEMTFDGTSTTSIDVLREQLLSLVKSFDSRTFFNVYVFENDYKKAFEQLVPMTRAHHAKLNTFANSLKPAGATNLFDALEDALTDPHVDTLYVLSDGQPSAGKYTETEDIVTEVERLNRLRHVQINTISIGMASPLLKQLAAGSSGAYREIR